MCRRLPPSALLVIGAVLALTAARPIRAQEPQPGDTLVVAADTLPVDRVRPAFPDVGNDPRLTWLGDTLAADTTRPKFSDLPEVWPDSVVRIYTPARPGSWAAWRLPGTALLGRGAYNLLDVLESEFPVLGQDLGGSGLGTFLGSPHGTGTNVQVVIDGVPAGSAFRAAWDLRQMPLEAVAEIAWFPGPQVAAWGGNGTGGVLEITTRRSLSSGARSMIAFLLGSFDAQAFSGYFGRPITQRGDFFLGANFDATDGAARSGDFTRNQTLVRVGWDLGRRHRIEITRRGDGLSGRERRFDVSGSEDVDTAAVHAFYTAGLGPLTARLHGVRESHDISEGFRFDEADAIVGRGEKTDVRGDVAARIGERIAVWAGGARVEEDAESEAIVFFVEGTNLLAPPDDAQASRIAPRVTTEIAGGAGFGAPADPLAANAAVRRISFDGGIESGMAWQAELLSRPAEGLTLRASAGRAVRPADFVGQAILARLAADGGEIHPGRLADPGTLEAWTEWRVEAAWRRDRWRVAGRAWRASGEDAFLWLPPTAWTRLDPTAESFRIGELGFNTFDVVDLTATGLEADVHIPLPYDIQGIVRARWLDETIDASGEPVPYVPELQALGQLRWAERLFPNRDLLVEARMTGRFVGERSTLSDTELPAVLIGDFLVQATVINLTIYISLKNLTGQTIRTEEAFAVPGLEGFFGINWRFRN